MRKKVPTNRRMTLRGRGFSVECKPRRGERRMMLFLTKGLETPLQWTGCLRGDGEAPIWFQQQPVVSTALCHFFYPSPLKRLLNLLPVLDSASQHHLCSFLARPERGASEDVGGVDVKAFGPPRGAGTRQKGPGGDREGPSRVPAASKYPGILGKRTLRTRPVSHRGLAPLPGCIANLSGGARGNGEEGARGERPAEARASLYFVHSWSERRRRVSLREEERP